ncbi:hypothetical protein Ait01nite_070630 [Actinoplanes italicus]|nr:hypothetical protein Ait01nite_070630 [Actinoplanes italicus]
MPSRSVGAFPQPAVAAMTPTCPAEAMPPDTTVPTAAISTATAAADAARSLRLRALRSAIGLSLSSRPNIRIRQ